jgi:hypothetical protein
MIDAMISLCDETGIMAQPWAEAGFRCYCVDVAHSIRKDRIEGNIHFVWGDARSWTPPKGIRPVFVAAFPPCTHTSVSGVRDHAKKRGVMLRDALETFEACRQAAAWSGAPYMLENPVTVLSSLPHIGKPDFYFHPSDYTAFERSDNYTKKTCIWCGNGFIMPPSAIDATLADIKPDNRIHFASPGDDRADFRSATPLGFARAVFASNRPDRKAEAA